jgi:dUTP pyrophosphatase
VAQLVLECIVTPDVELVQDLDDTSRGAGGFGSTGGFGGGGQQQQQLQQ